MSWAVTPEPGSVYLCAEACSHRDCAANRLLIETACAICGEPIGAGKQYTGVTSNRDQARVAHWLCLLALDNLRLHSDEVRR